MKDFATIVPRVAFAINLDGSRDAQPLADLFRKHRVPTTWALADISSLRSRPPHSVSQRPTLAVGDHYLAPTQLSMLPELGIEAVLASAESAAASKCRPLPGGMWLLAPRVQLPKRRRTRWLPHRAATLKDILAAAGDGVNLVSVSVAAILASSREFRALEKLVREVAQAEAEREIRAVSVAEIIAELAARHTAKPQRSILRLAA